MSKSYHTYTMGDKSADVHIDENDTVQEQLQVYIDTARYLGVLSDKPEDELAFIDMLLGGDYSSLKDGAN